MEVRQIKFYPSNISLFWLFPHSLIHFLTHSTSLWRPQNDYLISLWLARYISPIQKGGFVFYLTNRSRILIVYSAQQLHIILWKNEEMFWYLGNNKQIVTCTKTDDVAYFFLVYQSHKGQKRFLREKLKTIRLRTIDPRKHGYFS